jgi:N-acyl-D-aspartate/D-glutamate deacylase
MDPQGTKSLVRNEAEQAAMGWAVALRDRGYRSGEIAEILTANAGLFRGKPWSGRTVRASEKMSLLVWALLACGSGNDL